MAMGRMPPGAHEIVGGACPDPGLTAREITAYGGFHPGLRASAESP
ncbi:MAG: hypothetical protein M0Z76_03290 [Gammaproteobacteria bacterium]|nr:hypothetical protein [Gammaproteobacteria bacterium]